MTLDFHAPSTRPRRPLKAVHDFLSESDAVVGGALSYQDDAPDWLRREVRFSQLRYFKKHRPRWEQAAIRALNRAYFLAHSFAAGRKKSQPSDIDTAQEFWRDYVRRTRE